MIDEGKLMVLLCQIASSGNKDEKKVVRIIVESIKNGDLNKEKDIKK